MYIKLSYLMPIFDSIPDVLDVSSIQSDTNSSFINSTSLMYLKNIRVQFEVIYGILKCR